MKVLYRSKAIRAKCLECACNQSAEVRNCQIIDCVLWPYRMGTQPSAEDRKLYEEAEPGDQLIILMDGKERILHK